MTRRSQTNGKYIDIVLRLKDYKRRSVDGCYQKLFKALTPKCTPDNNYNSNNNNNNNNEQGTESNTSCIDNDTVNINESSTKPTFLVSENRDGPTEEIAVPFARGNKTPAKHKDIFRQERSAKRRMTKARLESLPHYSNEQTSREQPG